MVTKMGSNLSMMTRSGYNHIGPKETSQLQNSWQALKAKEGDNMKGLEMTNAQTSFKPANLAVNVKTNDYSVQLSKSSVEAQKRVQEAGPAEIDITAKRQEIQKTGEKMLAQANSSTQGVLSKLR